MSTLFVVLCALSGGGPSLSPIGELTIPEIRIELGAPWAHHQTSSFYIHARCPERVAKELGDFCEQERSRLQHFWLESDAWVDAWRPRCGVVVHATRREYAHAIGRGSEQTSACCTVQFDGDRIVGRRLDLCSEDPEWIASGMRHELTHLVIADVFRETRVPPWADEGMAILSESAERRMLRLRELRQARTSGETSPLPVLFAWTEGPPMKSRAAFYGQSWLVAGLLVERSSPQQFVHFVRQSQKKGCDPALREMYHIDGVAELEGLWQGEVFRTAPDATIFTRF